jgi:co-chaperonin GroES (HSP10)
MKEMEVLVEDTVLFNYGQDVTLDGKKYWLTSETDIAVIFTA